MPVTETHVMSLIEADAGRVDAIIGFFPGLGRHGARVALIATGVVERQWPDDRASKQLTVATAHLHDIGKLAIAGNILEKPGKLTATEREHVERHAAIGANFLDALGFSEAVTDVVRHHHEWWNGEGYPGRLAGEAIPLLSRVIAVADALDAMMSNRPYRKAISAEHAWNEIERCAGSQFDPEVVAALRNDWPSLIPHLEGAKERTISPQAERPAR